MKVAMTLMNRLELHTSIAAAMVVTVSLIVTPTLAVTVSYHFDIMTSGNPVTDVVMYHAGSGVDDVYLVPHEIAPKGRQTLTHTLAFEPVSSLIVGVNERVGSTGFDVIMFTNDQFAADGVGLKWSQVFDSSLPTYFRHSAVINLAQAAHAGDAVALGDLTDFLRGPQSAAAAFDRRGSYSIVEFSVLEPPIGGDAVPEPATAMLTLLGMGIGGLMVRRVHRARAR